MQRFGPRQARLMLGGLDYLGTLLFGLDEKRLFGSSLTATMRLRTMAWQRMMISKVCASFPCKQVHQAQKAALSELRCCCHCPAFWRSPCVMDVAGGAGLVMKLKVRVSRRPFQIDGSHYQSFVTLQRVTCRDCSSNQPKQKPTQKCHPNRNINQRHSTDWPNKRVYQYCCFFKLHEDQCIWILIQPTTVIALAHTTICLSSLLASRYGRDTSPVQLMAQAARRWYMLTKVVDISEWELRLYRGKIFARHEFTVRPLSLVNTRL